MSTAAGDPFPNGILLLDKPVGLSSNAALQRAKRLLQARKAGHTGSLDPLASGLLPICLGEATKFSGFMLNADKRYRVTVRLGVTTTTGDAEGEEIERRPVPALDESAIRSVLEGFRGRIEQCPPMYSALKHQGVRLYSLARRGIEVDRPARMIEIHALDLLDFGCERLDLAVHCSKGTYVRVLAEDIGRRLGCGGHVLSLRRTAVDKLSVDEASTLEQLQDLDEEARRALLQPADRILADLPEIRLGEELCIYLRQGQAVLVPHLAGQGLIRLYSRNSGFFGLGEIQLDGRLAPRRLLRQSAPLAATQRRESPASG